MKNKHIIKLFVIALFLFKSITAIGQQPTYSIGKADFPYEGRSVSEDIKDRAVIRAKENAVRAYFSTRSDADSKRFDSIEGDVFSNIESYLISSTILGDANYSDRKTYSVTVQVQLNANKLNQKLVPNKDINATKNPELGFLFITRQLTENQKFDDRVYKRTDISQTVAGSSTNRINTNESEVNKRTSTNINGRTKQQINENLNASTIVENGGSTTSKVDKKTYKLSSSGTFNASFLERLTAQDWSYEPIELETEPSINLIAAKSDYAEFEEIQPATLQKLFSDLRLAGFKYLALGTLNVSLPTVDATLGLKMVTVEINAKIFELGERRVKTLLIIQPTLVSGFDQDDAKAQIKAIKEAGLRSAKEFFSQLSNKVIIE